MYRYASIYIFVCLSSSHWDAQSHQQVREATSNFTRVLLIQNRPQPVFTPSAESLLYSCYTLGGITGSWRQPGFEKVMLFWNGYGIWIEAYLSGPQFLQYNVMTGPHLWVPQPWTILGLGGLFGVAKTYETLGMCAVYILPGTEVAQV
jgi:hypothetical protein